MTKRRMWPTVADHARSESIAQANKILLEAAPMKEALFQSKTVSSLELSIRLGRMSDAANVIIKELSAVSPREFKE